MKKYDTNNLTVSLIIPVRNDPKHLRKCLQGIMESTYSHYECIVVDDGSSDETSAVAQQFHVKAVKLSRTHGPAYARNRGAAIASGEVLFFIDADVRVYPDTLANVAETFTMHPEIDALIGSYDDAPDDVSFISQYKNLFHHYVHQKSNENACTFWSGCGAIRREVFLEFGGFNVSYGRPAIEDIELGFRLTSNNHKIVLQKQIQVKHLKRWTFWGLLKTDIFDRGIPWTILILRDRTFPKDLNLRISQRISVVLVYALLFSTVFVNLIAVHYHGLLLLPFLILVSLILINREFYTFFAQKRGFLFATMVIPLHLLYYFYSGMSLILGAFAYLLGRKV